MDIGCLPISPNPRVRGGVGVRIRVIGSGLRDALRHDALSMSVSNNFVRVRQNGAERCLETLFTQYLEKYLILTNF